MFKNTADWSNSWITLDSWTPEIKTQIPIFPENNDISRSDKSLKERVNLLENRLGPVEGHAVQETRTVITYDDLYADDNAGRMSTRHSGANQTRVNHYQEQSKQILLFQVEYIHKMNVLKSDPNYFIYWYAKCHNILDSHFR